MDLQLLGIDRVFTREGRSMTVEYKTDRKAKETGNVYVEVDAQVRADGRVVPGWGRQGFADYIVVYAPGAFLACIDTGALHRCVPVWAQRYRVARCRNSTYHSRGLLVPAAEVRRVAIMSIGLAGALV